LRHPAEIGVAELGHPAASAPESREHDFDSRGRHRMFLCHPLNEIGVGYGHFVVPICNFDGDRRRFQADEHADAADRVTPDDR
jgi:hypothetical protein